MAGEYIFVSESTARTTTQFARPQGLPVREKVDTAVPTPPRPTNPISQPRIRQTPPIPPIHRSPVPTGMQARGRNR